jgi:hypothetical protein
VRVDVDKVWELRFDDGSPVRAASGVAPYGDGHLVVQDDATHAAWLRPAGISRVRVFPAVDGHEVFDEASGTKHLKPDLECATALPDGRVLLLGSGSTARRTRVAVVGTDEVVVRDLPHLYDAVARLLATPPGTLNLEGACVVEGRLRWFQRGAADLPSASVDVDLDALVAAVEGGDGEVTVSSPRVYELGEADGVALAVTDALTLPDGRVLLSAAAEDTPNPLDDGPVVAAALVLVDGDRVTASAPLPPAATGVHKVEGLALLDQGPDGLTVLAVVDDDDPDAASTALQLHVAL